MVGIYSNFSKILVSVGVTKSLLEILISYETIPIIILTILTIVSILIVYYILDRERVIFIAKRVRKKPAIFNYL